MKTYIFSCCQRDANGNLNVIDKKTPPTSAETPGEALSKLNQWFTDNACLPFREVT